MKKQMILLGMLMAFCMAEAKVTLPALFTDNMVLQKKSNVIFHGHSSTKKEVIMQAVLLWPLPYKMPLTFPIRSFFFS